MVLIILIITIITIIIIMIIIIIIIIIIIPQPQDFRRSGAGPGLLDRMEAGQPSPAAITGTHT